jgi:hypothetical protein
MGKNICIFPNVSLNLKHCEIKIRGPLINY